MLHSSGFRERRSAARPQAITAADSESILPFDFAFASAGLPDASNRNDEDLIALAIIRDSPMRRRPLRTRLLKSTNVVGAVSTRGSALSSPHDRPTHPSGLKSLQRFGPSVSVRADGLDVDAIETISKVLQELCGWRDSDPRRFEARLVSPSPRSSYRQLST